MSNPDQSPAALLALLADLLRDTVGPLEVSAAVIESDDGVQMAELISRIKAALDAFDKSRVAPTEAAAMAATVPAEPWMERWYGSGGASGLQGWSIVSGRSLVAYLGPDISSEAVTAIVMAHNQPPVAGQPAEPSPAPLSVRETVCDTRPKLTALAQVDPLDALRWGANVAETLLSIGRAIGFGRAQQMLGEQWEAEHNCAPRGRMGVTVKDVPAEAESLPVGSIRTWHKNGRQHLEWVDALDGCDTLPDGKHELYAAPVPEFLASHALSELISLGYAIDGDDLQPPVGNKEWDALVAARWAAPKGDSNG